MHLVDTPRRIFHIVGELRRAPHPRLAYICGWLGKKNLGDEAVFRAQGELFQPFSMFDYQAERSFEYINRLTNCARGGLLAAGTTINQNDHYLNGLSRAIEFLPTNIVFGSGVRDPGFWSSRRDWIDNRQRWREPLRRCAFIGVRGPISEQLLGDVGISSEIVGDPALAFFDESRVAATGGRELRLGLNIGQSLGNVWGSEEHIVEQYIILARRARECGWRVTWFVVWPADLAVTKRVAEESGTSEDILVEYYSVERYMDRARELTAFVGMKLHATILAICAGVPSLMIEYQPKCRDFMMSINQQESNTRADKFDGMEVVEKLECWSNDFSQQQQRLLSEVRLLSMKQRQTARKIVAQVMSENR